MGPADVGSISARGKSLPRVSLGGAAGRRHHCGCAHARRLERHLAWHVPLVPNEPQEVMAGLASALQAEARPGLPEH